MRGWSDSGGGEGSDQPLTVFLASWVCAELCTFVGKELSASRLWPRPASRARLTQFLTHKSAQLSKSVLTTKLPISILSVPDWRNEKSSQIETTATLFQMFINSSPAVKLTCIHIFRCPGKHVLGIPGKHGGPESSYSINQSRRFSHNFRMGPQSHWKEISSSSSSARVAWISDRVRTDMFPRNQVHSIVVWWM